MSNSKSKVINSILSELDDLLKSHLSELDTDWHGYAGTARASLKAALESLNVQRASAPELGRESTVKSFQGLEDAFETSFHHMTEAVAMLGSQKGNIVFSDGRSYEIVWGAYVSRRETALSYRIQARCARNHSGNCGQSHSGNVLTDRDAYLGNEMPEELRQAFFRGSKRLEAWRHGGPFPATVDELFAER